MQEAKRREQNNLALQELRAEVPLIWQKEKTGKSVDKNEAIMLTLTYIRQAKRKFLDLNYYNADSE